MTAAISRDGRYRYALWRDLPRRLDDDDRGTCLFVMLNPSIADAAVDDPTIRRCRGFADSWGYSRLAVGNLYGLRSTDPAALTAAADPVGPLNDRWLARLAGEAARLVAAWGALAPAHRVRDAVSLLALDGPIDCLGTTRDGAPRHPLYVPRDAEPTPWLISQWSDHA